MLIVGAPLGAPTARLSDLLRLGLETRSGEVALLSNRRALTWAELEDASSRLAAGYLLSSLRVCRAGSDTVSTERLWATPRWGSPVP
ncbi:MAG: hypothetical protein JST53_16830 [Actinobacteria bacterium]|nr:hypothetical protein [Actinomycetota bacterium]